MLGGSMKKLIVVLSCAILAFGFSACNKKEAAKSSPQSSGGEMQALIDAAKAEGALTVYGSCEEEYISAAAKNFEKKYGIPTKYQRLSTSEVYTKISEEYQKKLFPYYDKIYDIGESLSDLYGDVKFKGAYNTTYGAGDLVSSAMKKLGEVNSDSYESDMLLNYYDRSDRR